MRKELAGVALKHSCGFKRLYMYRSFALGFALMMTLVSNLATAEDGSSGVILRWSPVRGQQGDYHSMGGFPRFTGFVLDAIAPNAVHLKAIMDSRAGHFDGAIAAKSLCRRAVVRRTLGASKQRGKCSANQEIWIAATPTDPIFKYQWPLQTIAAPRAWNLTTGSEDALVMVSDTGIDLTHPDLVGNLWVNQREIPGNAKDDDQNGYTDDIHGMNAITGSGDPQDDQGHGTHVAGIIGAVGNNNIGMSGVAWRVRLIAGKFLGRTGSGSVANAVKTINYAISLRKAGYNLVAINASWGAPAHSAVLLDAVKAAADAGILIVAAAGNSSSNNDRFSFYPASYAAPNVIAVASSDSVGRLSSFSNYGERSVHLAAPGDSIYSTIRGGKYGVKSGTSMAAPYVSGVAVLGWSACSTQGMEQLRGHIVQQGLRVPLLNKLVSSGAVVNAMGVVAAARQACAQPTPSPIMSPDPDSTAVPTASPIPTVTPTATPAPADGPGITPSIAAAPRFVGAGERTAIAYSIGSASSSQAALQFVLRDASNRVTRCPDRSMVSLTRGKGSVRIVLPGDTKYFGSVEVELLAPRSVATVRLSVTATATLKASPQQASQLCAGLKSAVERASKS